MKKLYGFIIVILLGTTSFISTGHKKVKPVVVIEEDEEVILTAEEKYSKFLSHAEEVLSEIKGNKPSLEAFTQGLKIHHGLMDEGKLEKANLLSIIDFSLPSTEKRFWVIDLEKKKVIENIVVSHGRNSGLNEVKSFSNKLNSYQSSMGAYIMSETYHGKYGLSLRMDGLEKGINDKARDRAIVMHTAPYADPSVIKMQGRLGRSLGCPAIPMDKKEIIKNLSGGSLLFIYGKDENYKNKTSFKEIDSAYNTLEKELSI